MKNIQNPPVVSPADEAVGVGSPAADNGTVAADARRVREWVVYGLAVFCMLAAILAIFLGLYIEPRGEVHNSLLTYFGISSAFCGSLLGISAHYSSEMGRFKAEMRRELNLR